MLALNPVPDGPLQGNLLDELSSRFEPLKSERVVLSAFAVDGEEGWSLTHASLLVGPPAMARSSWGDWERRELAVDLGLAPKGLAADLALRDGTLLAVRQSMTMRAAVEWLRRTISDDFTPAVGNLPRAAIALDEPRAPVLARPGNDTPASGFVLSTVRPVTSFLFGAVAAPAAVAPDAWEVEGDTVRLARLLGIDVPTDLQRTLGKPAAPGVLIGRVSRRAWIARVMYEHEEELLHVWLRLESARVDPHALELEIREYIDGDLADCRRLRLADVPLPARIRGRLGIKLPTLGRGIERTLSLYDRDGELLDQQVGFNFVESIHFSLTVNGSQGPEFTAGDGRPPAAVRERLNDLQRVENSYRSWLGRGARRRVISGRDATGHLRARLARARKELLVMDPYFGADHTDWSVLDRVSVPVRILTGWKAQRPPSPRPGVQARKWTAKKDPIPYHDRFYLWEESGLHVGTSPSGLTGNRAFRIDELAAPEVRVLKACFAEWWTDSRVAPL
ncbi:MAG TPA: hypothetical protein VGN69_01415 [Solirubrobacteraceae bacterium]|nr:hypothetical protein [Solirubrobacteraceae bacterium]